VDQLKVARRLRIKLWPKRRIAQIALVAGLIFSAYSLGGYFGIPALVRYVAQHQVATSLNRRVVVGPASFNPYKLRLIVNDLHIADRDTAKPFVDIARINLRLSWTSFYRLALVVKDITVDHPSIRVARVAPQKFDCSDLFEPSPTAKPSNGKTSHFAISNIQLNDGEILFDDRVLNQQHRIEKIRVHIPFIANLPTDVDIYVQPLLQMTVDGSAFNLVGRTKPFRNTLDSVIDIDLKDLDLTRFTGYLPKKLPIKLTQAALSAAFQLHFIQATDQPKIRLAGKIGLDNVAVRDLANSPLVELKSLQIAMSDVEPLNSFVHLAAINIDSLTPHLVLNQDRTTNLTPILAAQGTGAAQHPAGTELRAQSVNPTAAAPSKLAQTVPSGQASSQNVVISAHHASPAESPARVAASPKPVAQLANPVAAPSPAPTSASSPLQSPAPVVANSINAPPANISPVSAASPSASPSSPLVLDLDLLQISNSAVDVLDKAGQQPVTLKLQGIHARVIDFTNTGTKPASYEADTDLSGSGHISAAGEFNLKSSQATSKLTVTQVDIPALQGFAQTMLAATIAAGKLSAQANISTTFAPGHFDVRAQPAELDVDSLEIRAPNQSAPSLGWKHFDVKLAQTDLASHQANVEEVRSNGLYVAMLRDGSGNLNLTSLIRHPQNTGNGPAPAENQKAAGPQWRYRVASVILENSDALIADQSRAEPIKMEITPLNLRLNDLTNDFSKPIGVEADGTVNHKGTFKLAGQTTLQPFKTRMHINTRRIELAGLDPLLANQLNAKVTGAKLTMNGDAEAELVQGQPIAAYRGGVTLGNVRVLDRLTGDSFLRWYALTFDRVNVRYRRSKPWVRIGNIRLSDFYARVILNSDARLNLRDAMANPHEKPVSLTRAHAAGGAPPAAQPSKPVAPSKPIPANIAIGNIVLRDGRVDYTDNFIKPNYSADLTELNGKIGEFGTETTQPADVLLTGKVNGNSPLNISGSVNPLLPMASLELKANAQQIELAPITPYTTKYTGYPITNGTLNVDVHYLLANQQLTAENHIVLDQLSFGDRVQNSTASNLPIRLAVAILKDPQGKIDLKIPVSGSLSDPKFSIAGVIWHALVNIIMKAVTSPFTLLASAVGGSNQDLSYVKFAPGYALLTQAGQTKMQTLTKALQQRPSLKLEITGRVDPKLDTPGLREAMLETAMKRQKTDNEHLAAKDLERIQITPDEYNKYLWRVYKAAKFEKPRDIVGMTKRMPPDEMKKMLLAHTSVSDSDLRHLADARAAAVNHALSATIAGNRLLTGAPKLNADGITGQSPTTRADLSLQ
jgi:Domain of Unknown Function (DUF748)